METRANYLLVASFVLAIVACSVGAALLLLNLHPFPETRAFYEIDFKGSVQGLKVGAPVSLSGIPIGNVRRVQIDPVDPSRVRVIIEVQKDAAIRVDSIASLDVSLIFGEVSINISGGSEQAPPLTTSPGRLYPMIAARPSEVATVAENFLQKTIEVANALTKTFDERTLRAVSEKLQASEQATARATDVAQNVDKTLDRAHATVGDIRERSIALNAQLANLRRGLATAETNIDQADITIKSIGTWIRHFDNMVQEIRPEADRARNSLNGLDGTILDADELIGRLGREIDDFERAPAHTLFGKSSGGYRP